MKMESYILNSCAQTPRNPVCFLYQVYFKTKRVPHKYRSADKSLARPGRKQPWKHVRNTRDSNKIETRAAITFLFLQNKASKEIHAIPTEILACFLLGRAKDLSAPLYTGLLFVF